MLGMYEQHNNLLQLLSQTTDHESLIEEYRAWIVRGNELAWPRDREEWEKQGYALLARISEVFGPSTVQTMLQEQGAGNEHTAKDQGVGYRLRSR